MPLDRALVSFYRLSITTTMSISAAVWSQFATKVFEGVPHVYIISESKYGRFPLATARL